MESTGKPKGLSELEFSFDRLGDSLRKLDAAIYDSLNESKDVLKDLNELIDDAETLGVGIMIDGKRIDPATIYKDPNDE